MNRPFIITFISIFFIMGCSLSRTNSVTNHITLCNAGAKIKLSGNLEAKIEKNIKNGLTVTAGIERDLEGYFLNNAKVSEANAVALYKEYIKCLDGVR